MYCQKKLVALVLFAGLFFMGCDKEKESGSGSGNTDIDLEKILEYPYSALTPDQQKAKLENESMDFLEFGNALKASSAIEAFQNLGRLLDEDSPEIIEGKEVKEVKETVQYAEAYGIFTWEAKERVWVKTASTSELKFVFPAKKGMTSNNAVFSVTAVSSGIPIIIGEGEWDYETDSPEYETTYYLPKSTTGILTIGGQEAAQVKFTAEYKDNKEVPVKSEYKITTNDGYVFTGEIDKATESKVAMKMTYNDNVMFEAVGKSGIKIDQIIDLDGESDDYALYDKANAYMKLMDNLVLVYEIDIENYLKEIDAIEEKYDDLRKKLGYNWDYDTWSGKENYFTLMGQYERDESAELAKAFNQYMTVTLASTNDGCKIADVIAKSEPETGEYSGYWDSYSWDRGQKIWTWSWENYAKKYDYYQLNQYLKFNDKTEVEMSVYFSEGFNNIENKWEDFVKAFDR